MKSPIGKLSCSKQNPTEVPGYREIENHVAPIVIILSDIKDC